MIKRALAAAVVGGLVGAILCGGVFLVGALLDGTGLAEASAFSLLVAVAGGFLGAITGAVVGLAGLGLLGGALVGLLVALIVVAFYVLTSGPPERYAYFLSESRVILVVLAGPLVLTGIATAWLLKRPRRAASME